MRLSLAAALLVLACPRIAAAGVTINELLPDPAGADAGYEWVELYNDGGAAVDVGGWTLWRAKSAWGEVYEIPAGTTVPAGGFLLIGDEHVTADLNLGAGQTLDLGNATSNGDAVQLRDAGGDAVDTVVYGPNNSDGFLDDTGAVAVPAAKPGSAQSLARHTDGLDTDQSDVDFVVAATPTPGATNDTGGTGPVDCPATTGRVVINELLPDPPSADAGYEWIELHNAGSQQADLSGWTVERATNATSGYGVRFVVPDGVTLAPGAYLLIADWAVSGADLSTADGVSLGFGNAGTTGDAVRITDCFGDAVDTVVYGPNNDHAFEEDDGSVAVALAPKPVSGLSLARHDNGHDTDVSGDDFVLGDPPTPGAPNPVIVPPICEPSPGPGVVINELLPVADGTDKGQEWIELYNTSSQAIRLDGWEILRAKNATGWGVRFTFPGDSVIEPGAHLLIADWLVGGADYSLPEEVTLDLGNATSSGDTVRLDDCTGDTVDTVVYGPNNEHGFVEDSGEEATNIPAVPKAGQSLARVEDGYDSDISGQDFVAQADVTPGGPNPVIEPVVCTPSTAIKLNEILSDPDGADKGYEWFELYNSGGESVSIAGWYVSLATQPAHYRRKDVVMPPGTRIDPGGFLVVGDELVEIVDVVANMNVPNGTNGGAVRLYDCEDNPVDTVVYGSNNNNELIDDNDRIADPAPKPGVGKTLSRVKDGVDSDSPDDWVVATPTPGASNSSATAGDGAGSKGRGCGKKSGAPGERRGCSTVPLPLGGLELMLLVAITRRRRS